LVFLVDLLRHGSVAIIYLLSNEVALVEKPEQVQNAKTKIVCFLIFFTFLVWLFIFSNG